VKKKGLGFVVPDGYFIFSKPQGTKEGLAGWEKHFNGLGIKTITLKGARGFYLLREGVESLGD
jgi:hypothetical protein